MRLHDYLSDVRWFTYSPDLAKVFTPTGAILLCWIIWKSRDTGGTVEATVERIMDETGLSERNIETAKERLKGILTVKHRRLEHRTFYAVDAEKLEIEWKEKAPKSASFPESAKRPSVQDETQTPERTKRPPELSVRTTVRTEEQSPLPPVGGNPLVRSRRKRSVPLEPSEDAKRMIQSFAQVYGERFRGSPYRPDATKDVLAAQSLIASGVTPEEVAKRFDQCTRSKGWNCKRVLTLPSLAKLWNETGGELAQEQRTTGATEKNPLGAEWLAMLEEEQKERDLQREQRAAKQQDKRGVECTMTQPK
jgi:hypothetical protein